MSSISITLIQTHLNWENKEANLQMLKGKIESIKEPTQIVVLPEMFSTGFSMNPKQFAETMDGNAINWMKSIAKEKKVILTGSLIIKENGNYYNRLIWMLPNGQYGCYDKRHLFAFAEENQYYAGGTQRFIASVNGWRFNMLVCYDLRFPIWARQQFNEKKDFEYDVLVYVANWPERRNTAWKSLLRARAIENQCYVVGVNRVGKDGNDIYHSGDSMVVDPLGEILYHKEHDEDVYTITLNKNHLEEVRRKFQFWRDSDEFKILV